MKSLYEFTKKSALLVTLSILAAVPNLRAESEMDATALGIDMPTADVQGYNSGVGAGTELIVSILNSRPDDFKKAWRKLYDPSADVYKAYRSTEKGYFWKGFAVAVDAYFSGSFKGKLALTGADLIHYTYHKEYKPSQEDTYWIVRLLQTQFVQTRGSDSAEYMACKNAYSAMDIQDKWPPRIMECNYYWLKTLMENMYQQANADAEGKTVLQQVDDAGDAFRDAMMDH